MSHVTTVGKILLKKHLPVELHNFATTNELESKNISELFDQLARKHAHLYDASVSELTRLGFEIATRTGTSVTLNDLLSPVDKPKRLAELAKQVEHAKSTIHNDAKLKEELIKIYSGFSAAIEKEIISTGVAQNNVLAKITKAGARGKPSQLRETIFAPVMVSDHADRPMLDFPITHSFAEGLMLPEYLATTFGARKGAIATKLNVAKAGYFSKQLARASMIVKVEEHDCGTDNGLPVGVEDKDSIGCFLAKPVDGFRKNHEVTGSLLQTLKNKGIHILVVRSPMTCQASSHFHHGAVCQMCIGKREHVSLEPLGAYVGMTASTSAGEPLSQSTLSTKHTAGSISGPGAITGFKLIDQLANIPASFPGRAAITEVDGTVTNIREAAQGGHFVEVEDQHKHKREYYVTAGYGLKVKKGQTVEAGDVLSEGVANPAEIVQFKGIGEGRKYFMTAMRDAFGDSGIRGINRRNFELISRSLINHVKITNPDGLGNHLQGQVISYNALEKEYTPRLGSVETRIDKAYNKFLEKPVLHHTIGTRITHSIITDLKKNHVDSVLVCDDPPDFMPEMQRLLDVPAHEADWMHQLYSTNLERRLISAVNTGSKSDLKGPSPVSGLAYSVGFGQWNSHKKKAEEEEVDEPFDFEVASTDSSDIM